MHFPLQESFQAGWAHEVAEIVAPENIAAAAVFLPGMRPCLSNLSMILPSLDRASPIPASDGTHTGQRE